MKMYFYLTAVCVLSATIGCGSPANSIPTSSTAEDAQVVEQAQQKAAQEEMAQQGKQ